ncbi:hypothetical protein BCR36DRAFT_416371 [Piromyces finnis]|uniref:RlpA-like protein double-psi beta-barrel domain-containing protein n=1 Tax=Piromyces finnis TaxID=1754191 RepID=A0A1Y1UVP2_9FUNG|nr:hypothetical protein BCR36DRAFT_416371 [Piromyces finnis]|eukprot:ORX42067.1 hypothetical protein BCR36DRAFT_416371 [Piromyces finnis]
MKIFNFLFISSIIAISFVLCGKSRPKSYEMTHYGCPEECHTQKDPACGIPINTKYFVALATSYPNVKSVCGQYAIVMLANGNKKLVKAKIVDTCGECETYHVDLSYSAFTFLRDKNDGVAEVVWGIYSPSGKKVAGPYSKNFDSVASKLGMSKSAFIASFNASALRLASSGSNTGSFSSSGAEIHPTTTKVTTIKKTTTTRKTTTTPKPTTVAKTLPVPSTNSSKIIISSFSVSKSVPTSTKQVLNFAPKTLIDPTTKTVPNNDLASTASIGIPTTTTKVASQTNIISEIDKVNKDINSDDDSNSSSTVGILTAVGGTCIGAAGVGLLLMKKRNPNAYEDLKQKFPESFNQVKRGISRGATVLKRSVTKRGHHPSVEMA